MVGTKSAVVAESLLHTGSDGLCRTRSLQCLFNSIKKSFNHPTRGNFVVVMAAS